MDDAKKENTPAVGQTEVDEDAGVMIYGNVRIIDVDTGEILVNKRA